MTAGKTATFAEHIQELRNRLMWSLLFVVIGAVTGYLLKDLLLEILQLPLNDKLYYTTPTGAFSFVIKVCVVFGLVTSLPVIIYQTFAFFGPLIKARSKRIFSAYVTSSFVLACLGMLFAYYVSLPAAIKFLVNFGNNSGNIHALITVDEYFNFVLAYIAGFAALFQLPLVMLFINKVTPLPPKKLLGATRYVILASFTVAAVITPTPDPFNQTLMAVPIILLYFGSTLMVILVNRTKLHKRTEARDWMDIPETAFENMMDDLEQPLGQILQPVPQLQPIPVVDDIPPAVQEPLPPIEPMVQAPQPIMDIGIRSRGAPSYQPRPVRPQSNLISDFTNHQIRKLQ